MNEIKIFQNSRFGEIRTITEDGRTLSCGSDMAKALGYAKSPMVTPKGMETFRLLMAGV